MDVLQDIQFRFVTVETNGDEYDPNFEATVEVRLQVRKMHRRGNKSYWSDWETISYNPSMYIIEEESNAKQVRSSA